MKILLTGSEGMLGRAVRARLAGAHDIVGVDLGDGDLADPAVADGHLAAHAPAWVLHCAAWTDVDGAETARDAAMAANGDATGNLAAACAARGAGLTLISTDYVFDGQATVGYREDEPRAPLNHYGATKAAAEAHVERLATPWQIVRTSWLFGDGKVNFVKTMRRLLAARETLDVVDDQRGCPTYADDLADVLGYLVAGGHRGVFHATNRGETTWHALAREVARCLGADPERIRPCGSRAFPTAARRPAVSVLLSRRLEDAGCPARPTWQDAVARYVARLESGDVAHP
ncbi:dTDP-4-dehydrorhamnose reductase [bacterium]|nr:dTDP-4-dehydrorhamnose reductase [bacterium]